MKKKYLSMIIAALIAATSTIAPIYSVHAAYDNTTINTNLNSTVKPDHITLTWTKDPKTTQTITWRTSTNVTKGLVQYKNLTTGETKTFNATKQDFSTSSTDINTGCMNLFSATLENLTPGTKYSYMVGDGQNWSTENKFKTEASKEDDVKFIVFGDSQSGNADVPNYAPWNKTVQNAYSKNKDADFMMNVGDLVEKGQDYRHWNNWFNAAKGVIDNLPEMPVQGNHKTYNAVGWDSTKPKYFTNQFKVPMNGPDGFKGQVYSYDYGNVHFVMLDSQEDEESSNNDELAAIGADPRLVIYGTPIAFGSNQAEIIKGKAYVNPNYITMYLGGSYDSASMKLTIDKQTYSFNAKDLSPSKNVSLDALSKAGFNCSYNTQFNMIMINK